MKPLYPQLLTPEERVEAMKIGAALAFLDHGISVRNIDAFVKKAFDITPGTAIEGLAKGVVVTALALGVPLGVAAHIVSKQLAVDRVKERETLERMRYYRNAAQQIETRLAEDEAKPNVPGIGESTLAAGPIA